MSAANTLVTVRMPLASVTVARAVCIDQIELLQQHLLHHPEADFTTVLDQLFGAVEASGAALKAAGIDQFIKPTPQR